MTDIKINTCKVCKKDFPLTNEYFYVTKGKFKTSKCKPCKIKSSKEYRKNNREKCIKYAREWAKRYESIPENRERLQNRRKYVFQIRKHKNKLEKTNDPVKIQELNKTIKKYEALHASTLLKNMK